MAPAAMPVVAHLFSCPLRRPSAGPLPCVVPAWVHRYCTLCRCLLRFSRVVTAIMFCPSPKVIPVALCPSPYPCLVLLLAP